MSTCTTVLGFDYGKKRIGVAIGQTLLGTARALKTITSKLDQPDWQAITKVIQEWQPDTIIVGQPLNLSGEKESITLEAESFADEINRRFSIPVSLVDERFSSSEAEGNLINDRQSGRKSRRIAKTDIDKAAAQIIVQDFLRLHT